MMFVKQLCPAVRRFFILRRVAGRLVSRAFLLFLAILLLFLLQLLLFLPVFLLELLELLLLFLLGLLPSCVVGILLLNPLLLLDLLLLNPLALLILLLAELVQLLLMPLIELRVHRGDRIRVPAAGPSDGRTIVIGLIPARVCRRIPRLTALWLLSCVIGGRRPVRIVLYIDRRLSGVVGSQGLIRITLHIGLRLARVVGHRRLVRIILNIRLWLTRTIAVAVLWLTRPVGTNVLRSRKLGGWRDLDVWSSLLRVFTLRLTDLGDGCPPAAIGLNLLLLLYEGDGSGWGRCLGHHGAFLEPGWRLCCNRGAGAQDAFLLRGNRWRGGINLGRGDFPLADLDHVSSDGLRGREILL